MQGLSANEVGWFSAFQDPVTGSTCPTAVSGLKRLHGDSLHDWSVKELAQQVGVSRTVLAERFKHYLKQPPMQYLVHWRLQLAALRLNFSALPIKTIADRVEYESEAAFSRAYKRHFGLPPGDWRKRQYAFDQISE
jgi:AraC-like DNA-binding protein